MYDIAHIAIVVKSIEKSKDFYSNVLRCEFIGEYEDERLRIVYLKSSNGTIELIKYKQEDRNERGKGIIDHIAFFVPNINEAIEHIKKFDVEFVFDTPREINNMKIIFFLGPDGERIEYIEQLKK